MEMVNTNAMGSIIKEITVINAYGTTSSWIPKNFVKLYVEMRTIASKTVSQVIKQAKRPSTKVNDSNAHLERTS